MAAFWSRPSRARGLKLLTYLAAKRPVSVAPLAGAWIETRSPRIPTARMSVAPLAGAWIETYCRRSNCITVGVAPLAGAWIETPASTIAKNGCFVAPLAGAWIETGEGRAPRQLIASRPSRARGLKRIPS